MTIINSTDSFLSLINLRAVLIGTACAFALSACGDTSTGSKAASAATGNAERTSYEIEDDHAIGNANAVVTIVEHASVVCGACANWHMTVYPELKKKYVDSGLVRFVFREFPTSPENLAQAGFMIANCSGEDKFFENISLQFKRQRQIFAAAGAGGGKVKDEYIAIAKAGGLSEEEFEQCLANPEEKARYTMIVQNGIDAGVTGTPSFFINGEKMSLFTLESFDDALRPILGDAAPKAEKPASDDAKEETKEDAGH